MGSYRLDVIRKFFNLMSLHMLLQEPFRRFFVIVFSEDIQALIVLRQ